MSEFASLPSGAMGTSLVFIHNRSLRTKIAVENIQEKATATEN